MKYFLECTSPQDSLCFLKATSSNVTSNCSPITNLSFDAYSLLIQLTRSKSSSQTKYLEELLDQSATCGNHRRLMLTNLCHEWTGDIRLIHANLRPELNSFLPHILILNTLSSKYSS